MNAKQRVLAALAGDPVDRVPSGFWLHFPLEQQSGEHAVQAHMDFFEGTGVDLRKIMTESLVPCDIPIRTAGDWAGLRAFTRDSAFIQKQVEIVKRVLDQNRGEGFTLATIHGIVASAWHARGGPDGYETDNGLLCAHLRENPAAVSEGYKVIAEGVALLCEEVLRAGVDGIYYAALGGESYLFTDEEFERYIKPRDLQILAAAVSSKATVLHVCKDKVNLGRYADYPGDIVNWAVHEGNPTLEEGAAIFPDKAILGGLDDREGVLVDGPDEAIRDEVAAILQRMQGSRFLLGADCTLPTEIPYANIRTAVEATGR